MSRRLIVRARNARPSRREFLGGSLLWAALMGLNAAGMLWLQGWGSGLLAKVGLLFAAGGLTGFAPAVWLGRLLGRKGGPEQALAGYAVCLSTATAGVTAAFYALLYRHYHAQWDGPVFTVPWFYDLAFTVLVALYQFAALGLRLYFPVGFALLLAIAFVLARQPLSAGARFDRNAARSLPARIFR